MRTAVLRGLFNSSVYLKTAPFAVAKLSTWEAVRSFTTGPSNPWEPNRRPTPTKHYRNPPFVDRKTGGPSSGDNKTPNPTPPPPSADSSFAVTHEDLSLSGRYATALFRVIRSSSKDLKTLDHVWKDLETLKCCLNEECSRLKIIIETPGVDAARKAEVLQSLLPLGFSDLTVRFLLLLLENKRLNLLPKIIDAFENFYREAKGEVRCHVTSAENLTDCQKAKVEAALFKLKANQRLQITYTVAPSTLGGLVVRIGNRTLDYSVATRVERIKTQLLTSLTAAA